MSGFVSLRLRRRVQLRRRMRLRRRRRRCGVGAYRARMGRRCHKVGRWGGGRHGHDRPTSGCRDVGAAAASAGIGASRRTLGLFGPGTWIDDVDGRRGDGGDDARRATSPLLDKGLLLLFDAEHGTDLLKGGRVVALNGETHWS